jgi:thiol-disulfide isomerase/thioredoxin
MNKTVSMYRLIYISISILCIVYASCSENKPPLTSLPLGTWRGTLLIQNQEVPFGLDVQKDSTGGYDIYILNAQERLLLDDVSFKADTVIIPLHIFDASIRATLNGSKLTGHFIKHYDKDYRVPFEAEHGVEYRFREAEGSYPDFNFSGKFRVAFYEKEDTTQAVAVFSQNGNILTGTFLTPTGDYRFLEGLVENDSIHLSTFDGNYVYLFKAKGNSQKINGRFYSGKTKNIAWEAVRDENAALPDAESLTFLKEGYEKIDFSFPDVNGKPVTLQDEKYKGKVVILQIFGTWCPNCMDETKFLSPWYDKNKGRGVEIIGLAYERKPDFQYASDRVKKMVAKMKVNYDFVIAGTNDKEKASATLPMLNSVIAFPTTIFIGKDGKVKKIHTGFSGPGTGIYYDQLIEDFNQTVNKLLAEDEKGRTAKL